MVVKAKMVTITPMKMTPAEPNTLSKAEMVRVAEVSPELQTPVTRMAMEVMLQTTMVSIKTSMAPHSPCSTGWRVSAVAWIMGEEPWPASLELTARDRPFWIARRTEAPANPPTAAVPVNALLKMRARTPGTACRLARTMTIPPTRYITVIMGTALLANFPTLLTPRAVTRIKNSA